MVRSPPASRAFLLLLVVVGGVGVALVIRPFATGLFLAAVAAGALSPWADALTAKTHGKRKLVSLGLTLATLLAIILPTGGLTTVVIRQAITGVQFVQTALQKGGIDRVIAKLPAPLQALGERLQSSLPEGEHALLEKAGAQSGRAAAFVGGVLFITSRVLVQGAMMLIALYFLLSEGRRLVTWLDRVVPLQPGQFFKLLEEFRRTTVAVLVSTVATSGIQAAVAFVGYLIARVPNAIFFAFVTFFVGLIPAVGAASVSVLLALLLLFNGHVGWAIFLAIWGVGFVGLIDNIVKPLFIRGGISLSGAIIFFSLLGGLAAFGAVGLLLGPLVVTFFVAVMKLVEREPDAPVPP